uniref:VWFA domain-containing protein n=1 Tax=Anisakis simplex TaxID=6269 RepID=A0A0M3K610_ANISI
LNVTEIWKEDERHGDTGSGGHKLIMLFTDGVEEWPIGVINSRKSLQSTDPIRVFGFSMGYGTGPMPALAYIACHTNASYAIVDSISDVKRQSVSYLKKLSNVLAIAYANNPPSARPVTWVTPLMDSQGSGPTLTVSMPILNTMENASGSGVLGVAGIDIRFKQIAKILPEHEQMYAFIVNNNGIALYHPRLKIPKTEVYSVRRTACYDKRSRSRGGGRIQFGEADERVLRLMGLLDSIFTIDIIELERDSKIFRKFRRMMIDRNCSRAPLLDGTREYWCRSVKGTPLTIGFVAFKDRSITVLSGGVERPQNPNKALVGHYVPKRGLCRGDLDHVDMTERFNAFLEARKCEMDTNLPYALVVTLNNWTESWPDLGENETNFESLLPIADVLELERYPKPSSKLKLFAFNDNNKITITAYKQIFDSVYSRRLAVGGVQWTTEFIDRFFYNITAHRPEWAVCYQLKKSCHLVLSDGFIVAGKYSQQHLSSADALLFDYMIKKRMIKKLDIWLLVTATIRGALTQPIMVGGTCQFSRIKHREICSLEYSIYEITLTEKHNFMLNDGVCSREIQIMPFPDASLHLFLTDNACANLTKKSAHSFTPRRISECERMTPMYRRRRQDLDYTRIHPQDLV